MLLNEMIHAYCGIAPWDSPCRKVPLIRILEEGSHAVSVMQAHKAMEQGWGPKSSH